MTALTRYAVAFAIGLLPVVPAHGDVPPAVEFQGRLG